MICSNNIKMFSFTWIVLKHFYLTIFEITCLFSIQDHTTVLDFNFLYFIYGNCLSKIGVLFDQVDKDSKRISEFFTYLLPK